MPRRLPKRRRRNVWGNWYKGATRQQTVGAQEQQPRAGKKGKTLFVSDFDDTLAQTDANVYVTNKGERRTLTPAEYAVYNAQDGDEFDFSEFEKLINPRPIKRFVKLLKMAQDGRADKVAVLTARGHTLPVAQFLRSQGINRGVAIAALGNSDPQKKADYIQKHIDRDGYTRVAFIDDSPKNVRAVNALKEKNPNVRILVHHAKDHPDEEPSTTQIPPKSEPEKPQPTAQSTPTQSKMGNLRKILRAKVTNPDTGNEILVQTALRLDKNHPARMQADKLVGVEAQRLGIKLKPRK